MPPVNLNDLPEPREPPASPGLVAGRSFSRLSHSLGESRRKRIHTRSNSSPPSLSQEEFVRHHLSSRDLSPRSDSSRKKRGRSMSQSQSSSLPSVVREHHTEEVKLEEGEVSIERGSTFRSGTDGSFMDDDETIRDFDFDSPLSDAKRTSIDDTGPQQRYLFGRALPLWCTTRPNSNRITVFIAKYAPCFWCRQSLSLTTTNQAILLRLSALCGILGLLQTGSACYLLVVTLSDTLVDRNAQFTNRGPSSPSDEVAPGLWNINTYVYFAGFLGLVVLIVMVCARPVFRELDVIGSLRFMWCMLWLVPLQIICVVGLFDYHGVTEVWIKHWWSAQLMAWFRSKTCAGNTYNTLCVVPIDGLPYFSSEDEWCEFYYNTTACSRIKAAAQERMLKYSDAYYNANGAVAVIMVVMLRPIASSHVFSRHTIHAHNCTNTLAGFQLILLVNFLEGIISRPIVQRSRESNIPLWLTLPVIGCFVTGAFAFFSANSILNRSTTAATFWPSILYLVAGGLYLIGACLGYFISHFAVLNSRDKRTKRFSIALFLVVMLLTFMLMAAIFVQSVLMSTTIVDLRINDELRGELACAVAEGSCSYCNNDEGKRECPEWTDQDVKTVLRSQLKASAALAAIFMFYSIGAIRFGFVLLKHISRYQIEYI